MDSITFPKDEPTNVVEMQFLFQKVDDSIFEPKSSKNTSLAEICLNICFQEANTLENQRSLLVSTTIKRLLTLHRDFLQSIHLDVAKNVIDYVFKKWDSSVDVICYEAVDSFGLLLDIHSSHCPGCISRTACQFREGLVENLLSWPSKNKSIFKCINLLSNTFPWLDLMENEFVEKLYQNIGSPSLAVVICDIICSNLASPKCNTLLHLRCMERCLTSESKSIRAAAMDRLIPILVKKRKIPLILELLANLESNRPASSAHLETRLALVSMVLKVSGSKCWSDLISKETLSQAIIHCSPEVRLMAFSLVSIHPRSSTPYNSEDLKLMRAYLLTNAAEQSPAIRQKILTVFKQALLRIAETVEPVMKRLEVQEDPTDKQFIKEHEEFLIETIYQALEALHPSANFNRRLFSLSLLDYVYRQNYLHPPGRERFWEKTKVTGLLGKEEYLDIIRCLDDSFQLCQSTALDLLKSLHFSVNDLYSKGTDSFYEESMKTMRTIRSHNSLTASYRFQLYIHQCPNELTSLMNVFMDDCEKFLIAAEKNMMAITETPLHPILTVLVSVLPKTAEKMKKDEVYYLRKRLISLCYGISRLVTPVVHSMAPEGYIPEEELQNLAEGGDSTRLQADVSQLLLVCCWRAHKHVSEIFDWSVRTLYPTFLEPEEIHRIGEYFWLQLTECRHCGAFESAVDGFAYLCSFLWKRKDLSLPQPMDWLKRILHSLDGGDALDNLCSTRRSAGVPHLVVAILSTEPEGNGFEALQLAASSLLNVESRELKYRIHCLNVLKALISSSALRERVSSIIEPVCRLAVAGCSAETWSERNSSAQLAAALRTHIFGVTRSTQRDLHVDAKNRQSAHEFFSRYPSLYSFLYHQLENVKDEFSAFPTMIFLTHLYATNTISKYSLAPFIPLCMKTLLWCKAEKLRRLCAVATVSIANDEDTIFILDWLWSSEVEQLKQNHVNSVLLLLQAILIARPEFKGQIEEIIAKFSDKNCCEYNQNVLQEVQNQLEKKEDYYSPIAFIAKVQREIITKRSFEPILSCDAMTRLALYDWLASCGNLGIRQGLGQIFAGDFNSNARKFHEKYYDPRYINVERYQERLRAHVNRVGKLLPEDEAVTFSLLARGGAADSELIPWAKRTIEMDEESPKLRALDICLLRNDQNGAYIKILIELLQDEDITIREKTSTLVSTLILKKNFPLNPEICRYLLVKGLPVGEELFTRTRPAEPQDNLYDAIESNSYAEPWLFGDYTKIDYLLE